MKLHRTRRWHLQTVKSLSVAANVSLPGQAGGILVFFQTVSPVGRIFKLHYYLLALHVSPQFDVYDNILASQNPHSLRVSP